MSRDAINRVCTGVKSRDAINRICTGVKMTPTIKGWGLDEISLLFVLSIRDVNLVGRESGFKRQVISQSYRIILTPGS
ncbi:hypothetical protein LC607_34450 [Nostoc sp. CHAB 5824]|nr:hypothetical protein [Nostoc sp. CHAB 5824]